MEGGRGRSRGAKQYWPREQLEGSISSFISHELPIADCSVIKVYLEGRGEEGAGVHNSIGPVSR